MGSTARPTLADYNAAFTFRAEHYRAQAKILREQAETTNIAMLRSALVQIAEEREDLANSIEGLRLLD